MFVQYNFNTFYKQFVLVVQNTYKHYTNINKTKILMV